MKQKEVIKKILEKAIKNGFTFDSIDKRVGKITEYNYIDEFTVGVSSMYFSTAEIIFNHDFAKAFWGEKFDHDNDEYSSDVLNKYICGYEWDFEGSRWQAHLMIMVLEEEPVKYLEKFL